MKARHAQELAPPAAPTRIGVAGVRAMLWPLVEATIFRWSLHHAYRWRRLLLACFGAKLAPEARVRRSVRINCPWNLSMGRKSSLGDGVVVYANAEVSIGSRTVVSQYCVLSTWEIQNCTSNWQAQRRPIRLDDDVWIATESVVTAGAHVPTGAVVGARSVVEGTLRPWSIAAGCPARSHKPRPRPA